MPDDLYILEQSGLLAARHKRFVRNSPAYIRAFKKGVCTSDLRAISRIAGDLLFLAVQLLLISNPKRGSSNLPRRFPASVIIDQAG